MQVNIEKKSVFLIFSVIVFLIGSIVVYANTYTTTGHARSEIDWSGVTNICGSGQCISNINAEGQAVCSSCGGSSGGVSSVSGSSGITASPTTGAVGLTADTNYLQRRVVGTCSPTAGGIGQAIKSIDANGNVVCENAPYISISCPTGQAVTSIQGNAVTCNKIASADSAGWYASAGTATCATVCYQAGQRYSKLDGSAHMCMNSINSYYDGEFYCGGYYYCTTPYGTCTPNSIYRTVSCYCSY